MPGSDCLRKERWESESLGRFGHSKEIELAELTYGTLVSRALKLRCPRCGKGRLFKNLFAMHEKCSECSLKYERAPGYFLGSTYVNYGVMVLTLIPAYFALHFGLDISNEVLAVPLLVYCIVMPIFLFRYARAYWLAMDCYCDPVGFGMSAHAESEASSKPGAEDPRG